MLTYEHPAPEIILALGVVRREAGRAVAARPTISRIWSCMARCTWPAHDHHHPGDARRMEMAEIAHPAPARRAQPLETRMSGHRATLLGRLGYLLGRNSAEHSLRESIAELVQEAAEASRLPGEPPELDRHERLLIANVLRLRETTADDVMVPRADIVAMRADVTLAQAIELIRNDGHSRLPVYREQLDDVIGMIHIKDVFAYVGRPEAFSLEAILRKPLMVAPQLPVLDLLLQMRHAAHPSGAGGGRIRRHRRSGNDRGPGRNDHRRHRRRARRRRGADDDRTSGRRARPERAPADRGVREPRWVRS